VKPIKDAFDKIYNTNNLAVKLECKQSLDSAVEPINNCVKNVVITTG